MKDTAKKLGHLLNELPGEYVRWNVKNHIVHEILSVPMRVSCWPYASAVYTFAVQKEEASCLEMLRSCMRKKLGRHFKAVGYVHDIYSSVMKQ